MPQEADIMKIVDAAMYLDGGTTFVAISVNDAVTYVSIDYSLPWDGRVRFISLAEKSHVRGRSLEINGREEREWLRRIRTLAPEFLAQEPVVADAKATFDQIRLRFQIDGVRRFLELVAQERREDEPEPSAQSNPRLPAGV